MWITDILEALDTLHQGGISYNVCIDKIEKNIVYLSDGRKFYFSDLKEICNVIEFKERLKEKIF